MSVAHPLLQLVPFPIMFGLIVLLHSFELARSLPRLVLNVHKSMLSLLMNLRIFELEFPLTVALGLFGFFKLPLSVSKWIFV